MEHGRGWNGKWLEKGEVEYLTEVCFFSRNLIKQSFNCNIEEIHIMCHSTVSNLTALYPL